MDIPHDLVGRLKDRPADPRLTPDHPRHGTTGAEWLEALPRLVAKAMRRWELTPESPVRAGESSIVIDVLTQAGSPAILKLAWPSLDAASEPLALREWDGHGAVRLEAAEPRDYSLLLERLDADRPLSAVSILEACEVIGTLMTNLDRPAHARFDYLEDRAQHWEKSFSAGNPQVPRRLTAQARSHLKALLSDVQQGGRLIHTNLHDGTVLAPLDAYRGDWLAISPRALAGEPAFAVAPMMWQRFEETTRAHNARAHIRMRAGIISDTAGLDEERVRAWTFVRIVLNAVEAARAGEADRLTRSIMLAKMFDQ